MWLPDHKAHACVRPWGQSAVPMEEAVPEVVPDPSGTVVPAVSDSSAVLDEDADEVDEKDEDVEEEDEDEEEEEDEDEEEEEDEDEDEDPVSTPAGVGELAVPIPVSTPVAVEPAPSVPAVTEKVQAPSDSVVPAVSVPGPSGSPVGSSQSVSAVSSVSRGPWGTVPILAPSGVAASVSFTLDDRRKVSEWYQDELCRCSEDGAFVLSYRNMRVREVFLTGSLDVSIILESGVCLRVHPNLVRIAKVDTSGEEPEAEFAQYILKAKDDPSYWVGFRGSLVDKIGVEFEDHTCSQSRRLPAKALWVKKAPVSNSNNSSISTNVDNSVINIVNTSVTKSRSVVPTAAVLAAELIKRAAPTSTVGVPKCGKKL